jgi:hypothetical protein
MEVFLIWSAGVYQIPYATFSAVGPTDHPRLHMYSISSSILVNFSVADDVEIQSAYAELLDTNYTLLAIKQAEDIPSSGAPVRAC